MYIIAFDRPGSKGEGEVERVDIGPELTRFRKFQIINSSGIYEKRLKPARGLKV